ncbi:MAG: hypothetical protein R3Y50_05250 [Rikenellaceae bacterium]
MTGTYHQGEDIVIKITLYDDKNLTEQHEVDSYKVDLLIVSSDNTMLLASTDTTSVFVDCEIEKVDDYTLQAHFTPDLTSKLSEGGAKLEIRLKNLDSGETTISTNDLIFIEGSVISKLE